MAETFDRDRHEARPGCVLCDEAFDDDNELVVATVVVAADGVRQLAGSHPECQALAIVGHQFGVCGCTGFDMSRASAVELRRRLQQRRPV